MEKEWVRLRREERMVRRAAFLGVLAGAPKGLEDLAKETGLDHVKVLQVLSKLRSLGLIQEDTKSGTVVGAWGLTLVQTPHRINMREGSFYAWCAIDAVGIPAALGESASVVSKCHECGALIRIEVDAGEARPVWEKTDVSIWAVAPDCGRPFYQYT